VIVFKKVKNTQPIDVLLFNLTSAVTSTMVERCIELFWQSAGQWIY